MASEYSLRLKATLDTSSVQQELQRLRTAQQGGAGGGGGGQGGGGNLTSLGTTLSRLNNSIVSLQKSIEALTRGQKAAESAPQKGLLSRIRGMILGGIGGGGAGRMGSAFFGYGDGRGIQSFGGERVSGTPFYRPPVPARRRGTRVDGTPFYLPIDFDPMFDDGEGDGEGIPDPLRRRGRPIRVRRGTFSRTGPLIPPQAPLWDRMMRPVDAFGNAIIRGMAALPGLPGRISDRWQTFSNPYSAMTEEDARLAQRRNLRRSMAYWIGGMYANDIFTNVGKAAENAEEGSFFNRAAPFIKGTGIGVQSGFYTASLLANAGSSGTAQGVLGLMTGIATTASQVVQSLAQLSQAAAETALAIEKQKAATTQEAYLLKKGTDNILNGYRSQSLIESSANGFASVVDQDEAYFNQERYRKLRNQAVERLRSMQNPTLYAQSRRNAAEMIIA